MNNAPIDLLFMSASLVFNVGILLVNLKIKSQIADVKVYMHEKFLSREEFLMAMNPPTFTRGLNNG